MKATAFISGTAALKARSGVRRADPLTDSLNRSAEERRVARYVSSSEVTYPVVDTVSLW